MYDNKKITFGQKIAYGIPEGVVQLIIGLVAFYSFYFYSDVMLINPALIGTVFFAIRMISFVTDPLMGTYLDTHKPKKSGRFIPAMSIGTIIMFLSTTLIFIAPNISMSIKIIYFILTYFLYNIAYSVFEVPYSSIITTLSSNYEEVNKTGIVRSFIGALGIALVGVCIGPILKIFENFTGVFSNYSFTAAIFGLALVISSFIMRKMIRERVTTVHVKPNENEKIKLTKMVQVVLTNKPLLILVIVNLLSNTAWLINNAATIYFFQYVINRPELFILFITISGFAQLPLIALLPKITSRFGNRKSVVGATLISLIAFIALHFGINNVTVVFVASVIAGFGWNVFYGLMFGMVAHTIEYGEWRNGIRTAGISTSLPLIAFKIAMGLSAFILGIVLDVGKYVPNAVQSASAITAINFGFIYIPAILAILWLIFMLFYDLDKTYPQIIKELEERKNNNSITNQ